jgi:hypothetical protein
MNIAFLTLVDANDMSGDVGMDTFFQWVLLHKPTSHYPNRSHGPEHQRSLRVLVLRHRTCVVHYNSRPLNIVWFRGLEGCDGSTVQTAFARQ